MTRRYVTHSPKDENGSYLKLSPEKDTPASDISIDSLLQKGLLAIDRTMKAILMDTATGTPSRESIMNLKDVMAMLHELKKKEEELLGNLSEDELKKLANDNE